MVGWDGLGWGYIAMSFDFLAVQLWWNVEGVAWGVEILALLGLGEDNMTDAGLCSVIYNFSGTDITCTSAVSQDRNCTLQSILGLGLRH